MPGPIRYGKQLIIEASASGVTSITEESIINHDITRSVTVFTETIIVEDDRDILTHFLKLLDDQKAGKIDQIGLQCVRHGETGQLRIEKTWMSPSLR